ncbi:ester cyclase [Piscinibacter sakaiensis]|uniref:ester cyclase n=1 Tax=Piscinibacter sakaiensis TaxID=1547922 RepID=UPI003AAFC9CC
MSIEATRETMSRYLGSAHSDVSMMADDVVFTAMATGQQYTGREAVLGMLHHFYRVAFDATAETRVTLFGESNAMVEGRFVGKHIGEFAGVAATDRMVDVPVCVVYDLDGDKIRAGRIYFEMPVLLQQLGVAFAS